MRYLEMRKARIEIIPMIDIMLFLLVFFIMITLRMIPATGIASQLPQSSTTQDLPHPKIVVTLFTDGSIETDGQKLSIDELAAKLANEPDREKAAVTIAGAGTATLQNVLAVMDACRKAGIVQVGLAAKDAR
ncbi:outer membrane transport energization protein ExbD [Bradyrhizobium macuxiense]|uniref:Outer membrane transport energization protein ExbD n=1 Tax=Bradyrhizobium macuxiense TaxID=1755647 RepID=A0A560KVX4_9BRAD|nr:biopolymer transporter ExbD [Bradyrhizobium macuxiense]TWB87249.1 outer membrane transport energization protein ExbD [Bradyrhizobium macuxiense]